MIHFENKLEEMVGAMHAGKLFSEGLFDLTDFEISLWQTIYSGITDKGNQDEFIKRSDPYYKKTEGLHKKYFGQNTSAYIKDALIQISCDKKEISLILIGLDNYLLSIEELIAELQRNNFSGKLNVVIIDPIKEEIQAELDNLTKIPKDKLDVVLAIPKGIEDLTEMDWRNIDNLPGLKLVFANFSFHYVDWNIREKILHSICNVSDQLVFVERNLEMLDITLDEKIKRIHQHFYPLYQRIGESIGTTEEKQIMYNWLGMIVKDGLNDKTNVVCTHLCEDLNSWKIKIKNAGFNIPDNIFNFESDRYELGGFGIIPLKGNGKDYSGYLGLIITTNIKC